MSPSWNSGRPCLDYVGTRRWRRQPAPHEYLARPADLVEWGLRSGLVTEPPRVGPAQLAAALELREAIYRVVLARVEGVLPPAADVVALNAAARRPPVGLSLGEDGAVSRLGTVSQLLSAIARDALDLLAGDQIELVRECDGPLCSRLYVDASRGRNRRWCSNEECGNQAKVAAFRRRVRAAGA